MCTLQTKGKRVRELKSFNVWTWLRQHCALAIVNVLDVNNVSHILLSLVMLPD